MFLNYMFHCKGQISCGSFPMKCKLLRSMAASTIFVFYWLKCVHRVCISKWEVLFLCNYGRLFLILFSCYLGIITSSFQSSGWYLILLSNHPHNFIFPLHSYWFYCFYQIYSNFTISWGFAILHFCNGNFNIHTIQLDYVTPSIPQAMYPVQNNLH